MNTRAKNEQTVTIQLYRDMNPVMNDAYDRLISRIPLLKKIKGYSLFTITGCEPGVGVTAIAINLAVSLAASGWCTLLVDADIRKSPARKRLSVTAAFGLSDYLRGEVPLSLAVAATNIDNLYYLAGGAPVEDPVVLLNSRNLQSLVELAEAHYDYVIFDSPALNTTIDAALLAEKTSGAILVARYRQTKRRKIEAAVRELQQTGGTLIGIVLNRVEGRDYRRYIENYDYFVTGAGATKRKKK